jgi:N-acetylglucosaminyldiphosphoundecaprenol N-acetyl-beta-D-mannosaminyltransferase
MNAMQDDTEETPPDPLYLMGMRVDRVDMAGALAHVERFVGERGRPPRHIVTADASMVVTAEQDPEFREIVNRADLVTPDGAGILWAARRLGAPLARQGERRRSRGPLLRAVCRKELAPVLLRGRPPRGRGGRGPHARPPPGRADRRLPRRLLPSRGRAGDRRRDQGGPADILLVALGIPKQERFIARHKDELGVPVSIGVGGTLDVFSGAVRRAPVWMQNSGLEWAYRLASNPQKIHKVALLPRFALHTLRGARARSRVTNPGSAPSAGCREPALSRAFRFWRRPPRSPRRPFRRCASPRSGCWRR